MMLLEVMNILKEILVVWHDVKLTKYKFSEMSFLYTFLYFQSYLHQICITCIPIKMFFKIY